MLLVDTYINLSPGRGLGLFAKYDIPNGTQYWMRNELFDKLITQEILHKLPQITIDYIQKYGFQETTKNWYLCGDNAKFTNHSPVPNTLNHFDTNGLNIFSIVNRNIKAGEEIFLDYTEICMTCKDGLLFTESIIL